MASEVEKGQKESMGKFEDKHANLDESITDSNQLESQEKSLGENIKKIWQLLFKILELGISLLCLGFFYEPAQKGVRGDYAMQFHLEQAMMVFSSCVAYIVINSVFVVSWFNKEKIPFKASTLLSLIASALFLISGILLIVHKIDFSNPNVYLKGYITTATVLAFVNSIVFACDAILTYIQRQDFQNYHKL